MSESTGSSASAGATRSESTGAEGGHGPHSGRPPGSDPVADSAAVPGAAARPDRPDGSGPAPITDGDPGLDEAPSAGGAPATDHPGPDPASPRERSFGTAALALCIAVGLLLGYALGTIVPRITRPGDGSVEAGFARDMTTHHAQAVEMGLLALEKGESPAVRPMATDIVTGQQGEIGVMQSWLSRWGLDPTGSEPQMAWLPERRMRQLSPDGLMPGMADAGEMARLRAGRGRTFDVLFLQLMIRHHVGGIHMIDEVTAASGVAEVTDLAARMKRVQRVELEVMQTELARLGGSLLPAD